MGKNEGVKIPEKTCWHLYGLQTLPSNKFVRVVNKILKREYTLINSEPEKVESEPNLKKYKP